MSDYTLNIKSFQSGINEYSADGLLKPYEASSAINVKVDDGSFKTTVMPKIFKEYNGNLHSLVAFFNANDSTSKLFVGLDKKLKEVDGTLEYDIAGSRLDYLNFQNADKRVMICTSSDDTPFYLQDGAFKKLLNRRPEYNDEGEQTGWLDANGKHFDKNKENEITTYAPKGDFIELHYDRLWIAGDKENPDRLYFSTAGVNGADINDWTAPVLEAEANMHGGFIDVRSYDGSKIIGLKVIFNNIVVFKNKCAFKLFGSNPSNYQMIQMFSSNGAIADKSVCVGDNGAFFLNNDGIYFYDGTNVNLISQKIQRTISKMNNNYADKAVGIYSDSKYYIAFPTGNSEKNNCLIEYNTITKAFMVYDICDVQAIIEYKNKIYLSDGKNIRELFVGDEVLNAKWETPYLDFDKKNTRKLSNYIYFRGKGTGKVRFTCITERKEKTLEVQLTENETLYRKKLKNKGRMMKLKIENIDGSIEITSPEFMVELDED